MTLEGHVRELFLEVNLAGGCLQAQQREGQGRRTGQGAGAAACFSEVLWSPEASGRASLASCPWSPLDWTAWDLGGSACCWWPHSAGEKMEAEEFGLPAQRHPTLKLLTKPHALGPH